MSICPECGAQNAQRARFCVACGTELKKDASSESVSPQQSPTGPSKVLIAVAVVLAIAVVCLGAYIVVGRSDGAKTGTTPIQVQSTNDDSAAAAKDSGDSKESDTASKEQQNKTEAAPAKSKSSKAADAYGAVLDGASATWYTLAEMSGDDVPELVLVTDPGAPERKQCVFYQFDEGTGAAVQFGSLSMHPFRDSLGIGTEDNGLYFLGSYGSHYYMGQLTVDNVNGEMSAEDMGAIADVGSESLGTSPAPQYDISDRSPIEAMRK